MKGDLMGAKGWWLCTAYQLITGFQYEIEPRSRQSSKESPESSSH